MKTLRAATLGMRLSRPRDYVSCARYFGIAILTMMAVLSVLVLISAQQISQRQQDVVDARTPQQAEVSRPTPSLLSSETTNNWAGANVTIVSIAGGHEFPQTRHPGINRNPADGEAFASPAFLRALTSSHVLRLALGQAKIVGKIEATGLRGPTEMRLIKGIPLTARSQDDMTHTQKFGATGERLVDLSGPLGFVLPLAVVIAFAPMLLALLLVSRLRAPETGHRFAVLRAVGLDRTSTRVIAVGELAPPAVLGGLLAWLGFTLISQRLTHLPWTTFSFWSRDTHVPVTVQVLVIIGCVLFTTVVAAFTAGGGRATSHPAKLP